MAGRTFLMDGQAMTCEEKYSSEEEVEKNCEGQDDEDEMEYDHYGSEQYQEGGEEEEDIDEEKLNEENVPSMPEDYYYEIDHFLNKPPPVLKGVKGEGKKKKNNVTDPQGKKKNTVKSLPVINKAAVQSKVSTRRTGPGNKSKSKALDERLLQQAFEYCNKVQQEAMVEEMHEANMKQMKSNSAPSLRPQEVLANDLKCAYDNSGIERKPRSANNDFPINSNATHKQKSGGQGKKKPPNSMVRRLRSKTQTSVNTNGKPRRTKGNDGGFDTSTANESASSARNIVDYQALITNFEQGTHLRQLQAELEESKASMAKSRRAMQDISKEMSGKLRV